MNDQRRICDYEDSSYRTDFWEGQGREYEDLAERIALRRLLPPKGRRLMDIGAGFGRLSEFYSGYEQVVMLDYSRSLLRQAQQRLGRDGRIVYVAANFYAMPFVEHSFDSVLMVRVMHHVEDVPSLLDEVARVLTGAGVYLLEFASKRHLKAILRYALGRQQWSPFAREPFEFVDMNFDFHPDWMREQVEGAMFHVKQIRTVSHFRLPLLKRVLPVRTLAGLDGICQPSGAWWQLTPSVFYQCRRAGPASEATTALHFRCPICGGSGLVETLESVNCPSCGRRWPVEDGIYNFKEPMQTSP
ncbi:MAG: class I SAM-dependent methyltransferase [Anaerolineae bacterium]|jgi:ubiquinone/menaquinone biosynthesis C-methylase UbiE